MWIVEVLNKFIQYYNDELRLNSKLPRLIWQLTVNKLNR